MGYQVYRVGKRYGGYGVPATCEYPKCKKEIDRGVSYACGGEPFSELGCDRYFCSDHVQWYSHDPETGEKCEHEEDCDCESVDVCERCANGKAPFPYKKEHSTWIKHLLTDSSWAEWRKGHPIEVKNLKKHGTH